jgi:hypothetical protein
MRDRTNPRKDFYKSKYLCVLCGFDFNGERRGAALIVALIILLLFALIGSTIMVLSVNDDRMINDRMNNIGALAAAEAGIAEAICRLSLPPSDTLMIWDPGIPLQTGWSAYLLFSEEVRTPKPPVYYEKSIQMQLPESLRIAYSTAQVDTGRTLMIAHKREVKEEYNISYYNWNEDIEEAHDPRSYQGKYYPVEIIEATGNSGNVERTLQVEVAKHAFVPRIAAALSCNANIAISGKLTCCGHNHRFSTPWGTNAGSERLECFGEPDGGGGWHELRPDGKPHATVLLEKGEIDQMCTRAGCLPGIAAPGREITVGDRSVIHGNPDWTGDSSGAAFYCLYQMLNTASWEELEDRFAWQVLEPGTIDGGSFVGYYRCEGDLELRGVVNFTGVLWVTGKLKQRDHLSVNGIVYAGQSLVCNGNVWILGAVAIEGAGQALVKPFNGTGVLLYSREAIERALAAAGGYRIISRQEK